MEKVTKNVVEIQLFRGLLSTSLGDIFQQALVSKSIPFSILEDSRPYAIFSPTYPYITHHRKLSPTLSLPSIQNTLFVKENAHHDLLSLTGKLQIEFPDTQIHFIVLDEEINLTSVVKLLFHYRSNVVRCLDSQEASDYLERFFDGLKNLKTKKPPSILQTPRDLNRTLTPWEKMLCSTNGVGEKVAKTVACLFPNITDFLLAVERNGPEQIIEKISQAKVSSKSLQDKRIGTLMASRIVNAFIQ